LISQSRGLGDVYKRQTVPLLKPGGRMLALKGSKAQDEINESLVLQKKLKIKDFTIIHTGTGLLTEPTLVVQTRLI
jgi:16S rRNA (guanine527-N7)-methyltransferase